MGQAASDPIGSARQLKDQDLTALWRTQISPDGRLDPIISQKRDSDGRSSLHITAGEGKLNAVCFLLKNSSISSNDVDNNMITPLHSAVFKNHADVAEELIKAGSDVNAQDHQGLTALHWSVINGSLDCIDLLLKTGVNESLRNLKGQTAMDIAETLKPRLRATVVAKLNRKETHPMNKVLQNDIPTATKASALEHQRQKAFSELMLGVGKGPRRMLALGELWGTIKYTHPFLAYRLIKWDEDAMEAIEICSSPASSNSQFLESILKLVGKLCDANTRVMIGTKRLTLDMVKDDSLVSSVSASSPSSTAPSLSLPLSSSSVAGSSSASSDKATEYPKVSVTDDKLAFLDFTDPSKCQLTSVAPLVQLFASLDATCQGIVFDVRCLGGVSNNKFSSNFGIFFQEAFRTFISDPIVLPVMRQRMYQGLPEHVKLSPTGPNIFEHGFLVSDALLLHPLVAPSSQPKRHPFAFIIDKHTPVEIINIAIALQSRNQAYIVMQSEVQDVLSLSGHKLAWEPGIQATDFKLSDLVEGTGKSLYGDVTVQIRQNERFNPDGSVGLRVDQLLVVPNEMIGQRGAPILEVHPQPVFAVSKDAGGKLAFKSTVKHNSSSDMAVEVAMLYCYGQRTKVEFVRHLPFPIRPVELEYKEQTLPEKKMRVLALFRLWNAVRFFYPYKHLLSHPWEVSFIMTLNAFLNADTPAKYSLAIANLVSKLSDSHAYVRSPHLGFLVGTHVPSVRVKQIGGITVVTHVAALTGDKGTQSPRLPPLVAVSTLPVAPPRAHSTTASVLEATSSHTATAATASSSTTNSDASSSAGHQHIVVKVPSKDVHQVVEPAASTKEGTESPQVVQLGVKVGDILVAIDGVPVEERRNMLAELFSVSTPQAQVWRTDMKLLAGPEGSMAKLTIKRPVSKVFDATTAPANPKESVPQFAEFTLEVQRTSMAQTAAQRTGPVCNILEAHDAQHKKIAYLDLTRLSVTEVDAALQHISSAAVGTIVMDLRGHTRGTIFRLAPHLATHVTHVASTQVPVLLPSLLQGDVHEAMQLKGQQYCIPSIPVGSPSSTLSLFQTVQIIALINEETMSHGEYAAAVIKSIRPDTIFFGTQTTGSLGSVSNLPLPGGILVGFTAMGITKADGSEIQTRGIEPDFFVQELPESILIGRDDIMEAALSFIKAH